MSDKQTAKFVGVLLASRTLTHMMHLNTDSYAKHVALGDFYNGIGELADSFTEQYQGKYDTILEIPVMAAKETDPIRYIEDTRAYIEKYRYDVCDKECTSLQNVIDEMESLCNSTLYKLRRLK